MGKIKSALVERWKKFTIDMVRMRYGPSIDTNMVDRYLDHLLETEMKVPLMYQVNNFRRHINKIDALAVIESIEKNQFIVGGAASLFLQHNVMKNPFRDFILYYRKKRSGEKKTRDTYERGTPIGLVGIISKVIPRLSPTLFMAFLAMLALSSITFSLPRVSLVWAESSFQLQPAALKTSLQTMFALLVKERPMNTSTIS